MTHICVIGNSHLAALIHGWKLISANHPDTRMTFFGAAQHLLDELIVEAGVLKAGTVRLQRVLAAVPGCPEEISIEAIDEFWICGLYLSPRISLALYDTYWSERMGYSEDRMPVSDALYLQMIKSELLATSSVRLHHLIRSATDKPISLIQQPYPGGTRRPVNLAIRRGDAEAIGGLFDEALSALKKDGIDAYQQPSETLKNPLATKECYTQDSKTLMATEHAGKDVGHMNAAYGALMIEHMFSQR